MQKLIFELSDQPLPSARDRQIAWLQFCFAVLADVPMENVSVVHADDQEAVTVHVACTCAERHIATFTHWCTSEDEFYSFESRNGFLIRVPLEPHLGEI